VNYSHRAGGISPAVHEALTSGLLTKECVVVEWPYEAKEVRIERNRNPP
jgi:hypothetical protein